MLREHILQTIHLAHYYKSAFNRDQLYTYLRVKSNRSAFDLTLDQLIHQQIISENKGFLFQNKLQHQHEKQQKWSRDILRKYRLYIRIISVFPWISFIGLTGSNAFESCNKDDDLDIFIICKPHRLWICYSYIVLISLLFRKRSVLCVNYIVDENNLLLSKKTYYTGVQLVQMLPVYNKPLKQILIRANPWLARYLPNFAFDFESECSQSVSGKNEKHIHVSSGFMRKLNWFIYEKYNERIARKFPEYLGTSMILKEGIAKLHHEDNHDIYDEINSTTIDVMRKKKSSKKIGKMNTPFKGCGP